MAMLPVMRAGKPNLTVGWQIAPNRSKLSVYEWSQDGLFDVAPANLQYSFMETMDMHPFRGKGRIQAAIALWSHVASGAYQIEVLRWNQDQGQFSAAPETYAGYFPGVVRYEQLTRQRPATVLLVLPGRCAVSSRAVAASPCLYLLGAWIRQSPFAGAAACP